MRRPLLVVLVVLAALTASCGSDAPPVPSTITFAQSAALDAIGATTTVTVVVKDDRGRVIDNAAVTWTATGPGATLTPPAAAATGIATHSAVLTATHKGETIVTATSGGASGTLNVVTDQIPVIITAASGDGQFGAPNAALAQQIGAAVLDRLGAPLTDRAITFQVVDGGGSVSSALVTPASDGVARVTWTLGPAGSQHVSASLAGSTIPPATFSAIAVEGGAAGLISIAGGGEAVFANANAPTPPSVKVVNAAGIAVPGVTVSFSVTAGGGTISAPSVVTGADGVASLSRWTMGPVGSLNTVTASVLGTTSLTFNDAGCDAGAATGYGITLCYRTTMTGSQKQAFVSAAAKWSGIITSDLADVTANFSGACGGSVPTFNGTVDDLLIFATVEPIDGPNQIVGSAGPCFIRNSNSLAIIGTMRFDVADVVNLDNLGLLNSVILHEMGHVLGIGTLWSSKGLLQSPSTAQSSLDTFYSGTNGLAGFDLIGGTTYTGGNKVPVENTGGAGTINGHWRESILRNELMTGTINNSVNGNPLSILTVRSLQDLGYTVNTANADPFFLTLAAVLPGAATAGVSLGNDILTFPLWSVDARGRLTRVPR